MNMAMSSKNQTKISDLVAKEDRMADQREMKRIGQLEKRFGYLDKNNIEMINTVRKETFNAVRYAIEAIQKRDGLDGALKVVTAVRNILIDEKDKTFTKATAAIHSSDVASLLKELAALPEDEQIKIITVFQGELALKSIG